MLIPLPTKKEYDVDLADYDDEKSKAVKKIITAIRQGNTRGLLIALSKHKHLNIDHMEIYNSLRYSLAIINIKSLSDLSFAELLLSGEKSLLSLCLGVRNGLGE